MPGRLPRELHGTGAVMVELLQSSGRVKNTFPPKICVFLFFFFFSFSLLFLFLNF